jgi:hypothetical protein
MPLVTISDLNAPDAMDRIEEAKGLQGHYHRHLAEMEDKHDRPAGIHASEISKCYRQAVYTMKGEKKIKGAQSSGDVEGKAYWKKIFDTGSAIHAMIQGHLEQMAIKSNFPTATEWVLDFEQEVRINPTLQPLAAKWDIHSSCDGAFTFYAKRQPQLRVGLEIKTSKDSEFQKLREPKPEHVEQAHVYMAALDIPLFWLLYFNKDNANITPSEPPWLLPFDSKLWAKLESRFASWKVHVQDGTLPEQMPGMHCGFCPYKWTCKPPEKKSFMPKPRPFRRS